MCPIAGLTEKRRLPRLGKIHLGIKVVKDGGVEYPRAVDYFVCPPEVQKVFGEKPKELRILIPLEDEERWASQYYRCYSRTRGLICKGDGERAMRMIDIKTGTMADKDSKEVAMKEIPCQGRDCPDYGKQCKEIMNLQFLLPEVPGLGIWQIDTGSINSIRNINSAAELIKRIYGRIAMIPLLLTLETQAVQDPEGKKRDVYVLNLRTNQTLLELMQTASTKKLTTGEAELELPISDDEVPELVIPQNQEPKTVVPTTTPPPSPASVPLTQTAPATQKPVEEKAMQEKPSPIDLGWLKEQLTTLQSRGLEAWTNKSVVMYCNSLTGKQAESVFEAVKYLSKEDAKHLVNEIEKALAKEPAIAQDIKK